MTINWKNKYREVDIPSQGIMTKERPIRRIVRFLNEIADWLSQYSDSAQLPEGGTAGQVLTKIDEIDGNAEWQDKFPVGEDGQVLQLGADGSAKWEDKFPTGGLQYQVLQRDSEGSAIWGWVRATE